MSHDRCSYIWKSSADAGETLLSVYQLNIIEEPGKHGRMYADAQTQEGQKIIFCMRSTER